MLWVCGRCGTKYAVGLPYCPQCTSTDHREDGEDVAKITVHGGPSDASVPAEPATPAEDVAGQDGQPQAPGFDELTVAELRDRLRDRGLPTSGAKDELRDRLARAELVAGEG